MMKEAPELPPIPTLTKEAIEADRQRREAEFIHKVNQLSEQLDCQIYGVPFLTDDGRISARPVVRCK